MMIYNGPYIGWKDENNYNGWSRIYHLNCRSWGLHKEIDPLVEKYGYSLTINELIAAEKEVYK